MEKLKKGRKLFISSFLFCFTKILCAKDFFLKFSMKNEFMTPGNLKLVGKHDKIDKSDLNNLKFVQV